VSLFSGPVNVVELVVELTALAGAVGLALRNARELRREKRSRRRDKKSLEQVARAAAKESPVVAAAVDELERTGRFNVSIDDDDDDGKP
jgi:hypothetical protein